MLTQPMALNKTGTLLAHDPSLHHPSASSTAPSTPPPLLTWIMHVRSFCATGTLCYQGVSHQVKGPIGTLLIRVYEGVPEGTLNFRQFSKLRACARLGFIDTIIFSYL